VRKWGVALATLALAGCAAAPIAPSTAPDPALLATLDSWKATGRIALAAGEQGGSGGFTWHQEAATTRLAIRGPLGAGALEVVTNGDEFTLADGSGQVLDAAQARAQLEGRLGAQLPLESLRYWMLGIPYPEAEAQVTDSAGEPRRLIVQAGWQIRYDQFVEQKGIVLPSRLTAASGVVRLKVIVDDWELAPAPAETP
jgi:outer membrane lipoprotein LolB